MTIFVSACQRACLPLVDRGDFNSLEINEKWMTMTVSACQRTHLSLDGKGDFNSLGRKTLSLRQREQMTIFIFAYQ